MTARAAPIARGAKRAMLCGLMTVNPIVRTKKKVPMNSYTNFIKVKPHLGVFDFIME